MLKERNTKVIDKAGVWERETPNVSIQKRNRKKEKEEIEREKDRKRERERANNNNLTPLRRVGSV